MSILRLGQFTFFRSPCICRYTGIRLHNTSVNPKKFSDIPGPRSLPLFGTLWKYLPVIGEYQFNRLHWNGLRKFQQFGELVKEEIVPGVPIVWVFCPEDIERVFKAEGRYPERRSHLALAKCRRDKPEVFNTGGLLPTNGPEWWRLRSAFQRELSKLQCVRGYLPTTNIVISEFLEELKHLGFANKTTEDILPKLSRLFLELICGVALDIRLGSFSESEKSATSRSSKLIEAALSINSSILSTDNGLQLWKWFDTPLFRKLKAAHSYIEKTAVELISQKMEFMKEQKIRCNSEYQPSLLEVYLSSPEIDHKDVIGMAVDMILAGIDTTSNSVSFALYYLAKNPHPQQKLYEESCRLLQSVNCPVTAEILAQAQYTKAVIKESFRLIPVSVGIGRILAQDAVLSGYNVPKGRTWRPRLHLLGIDVNLTGAQTTMTILPFRAWYTLLTKKVITHVPRLRSRQYIILENKVSQFQYLRESIISQTVVVTQNQVSCRLATYFDFPNSFLPERWIKGEKLCNHVSPYLVLPFGHGPRTCIARRLAEQNMQVLLLKVTRRYKIGWAGGDLDAVSLLINRPDQPVLLTFQDRN